MPGKRKFEIVESQMSTYGASQGKRRNPAKRPKRTTQLLMSRSLPFPVSKKTQMVYTYGYAQPASAAFDYFTIACNDMFDLDRTTLGKLGNKQPTFFDAILSSTGPYKIFLCGELGNYLDSGQYDQCTGKDVRSPCFERGHRGG